MDYAVIALVILCLVAIEIFFMYFMISPYIDPRKTGGLVRVLYTLFVISLCVYLFLLSPVAVRQYFSVGEMAFIILLACFVLALLYIWVFSRRNQ